MRRGKCQLQGAAPPPAWLLGRLWVPAPAQFVYGSSGEPCKILASSQLPLALFLPPVPLPCFLHFAGGKHGFPRIGSVNRPRKKLESEAENKGRGCHIFSRQPLASAPCPVGNWLLNSSPVLTSPFQLCAWQKSLFRAQLQRLPQKLAIGLQPTIEEAPPSKPNAGPTSTEQAPEPDWDASGLQRLQCPP